MKVREFKELKSWNEEWQGIMEDYLREGVGVGRAADTARWLITEDEGGLYFDLDIEIQEWSEQAHFYFDMVVTPEDNFESKVKFMI